ncbi:unnamed protein product [Adineta ricciae]|uniref:Transposase n=1 Tax=Adineta ricciae TaxID=249248 RepID=A0A816D3H5_ADIRI|nr:unnamed protein product [Adineta ricciae]
MNSNDQQHRIYQFITYSPSSSHKSNKNQYFEDDVFNVQNDRIWPVSREETDKQGGIQQKTKFPVRVMVWLVACAEGLTVPVIMNDVTMGAERYISDVLLIALESDNKMLGNNWTYQQDGATPHTHSSSQNGVLIIFQLLFRRIVGLQIRLIYVHRITAYGMN